MISKEDKKDQKTIRQIAYYVDKKNGAGFTSKSTKSYDLLHTLEFDSIRKRMSVIVRSHDTGKYMLFCKGADTAIFKTLKLYENLTDSENFLHKFSSAGWRTLVLAYKILNKNEYDKYDELLNRARNEILERETKLVEACKWIF